MNLKERLTKQNLLRCGVALVFLVLFVAAILLANRGFNAYEITDTTGIEYETARVLSVLEDNTVADETIEGRYRGSMVLEVELLTGRYKGDTVQVTNYFSAMYNVYVQEGDTLSVRVDTYGQKAYQVSVYNYNRIPAVIGVVALFAVALILIGGKQGFWALVGLVFTFVSVVYLLLFVLAIAIVFRGVPYVVGLAVIPGVILFIDRKALKMVDYPLLLTFVFFFIFSGNMARIDGVRSLFSFLLEKNTFLVSILSCQIISNVPSAILLSQFTDNYKQLLLGVNIGGVGTLIASLASLITFREYTKQNKGKTGYYILLFSAFNFAFLIILAAFSMLCQ